MPQTTIAVLAGGVGAARMLRGLALAGETTSVTAVVNTGDDSVMHGLYICPDLDTVTYTLADAIDRDRGWGLQDETWRAMQALGRFAPSRPAESRAGGTWFNLGDQDLATHLYRTGRLTEGARLHDVTAEIAHAFGLAQRLLPMSDDRVRTRVRTDEGWLDFQDYFVGRRHDVAVHEILFDGVDEAHPLPEVMHTIEVADAVIIAPSNPLVSIGPVLALAGIRERLRARRSSVVAVSPIVAGSALKGPADRMLSELGHTPDVVGVAGLYADCCGTLVIDERDRGHAAHVEATGVRCVVTDTIMSTPDVAARLARTTLEAAS